MKTTLRIFLSLTVIVTGAIIAGLLVPRPFMRTEISVRGQRDILLLSSAIHTDIAIPLDDEATTRFSRLETAGVPLSDPRARWLVFGWGGRAFYTETPTLADMKLVPVLKALTVDRAVMHVEPVGDIDLESPAVKPLKISGKGLERLQEFLTASFIEDGNGKLIPVGEMGFGLNDRFFEAPGSFNILIGCNTWTGAALRTAGLRTGYWTPMPQLLTLSLDIHQ